MANDTKPKVNPLANPILPKPVTVVGSAFEPPKTEKPEEEIDTPNSTDNTALIPNEEETKSNGNDLPMPVVFGDDEDSADEEENKTEIQTESSTEPEATTPGPAQQTSSEPTALIEENTNITANTPIRDAAENTETVFQPTESPVEETKPEVQTETEITLPQVTESLTQPENQIPTTPIQPIVTQEPETALPQTETSQPITTPDEDDFNLQPINFGSQQTENAQATDTMPAIPSTMPQDFQMLNGIQPTIASDNQGPVPPQTPINSMGIDSSIPPQNTSGGFGTKIITAMLAVLVGGSLVVGGYFGYQKFIGGSKANTPIQAPVEPNNPVMTATPRPTPSPTPTPTPTPAPLETDKKAELKIKILNGSGIKGEAAKMADLLEAGGFENIKTGNAENFEYTKNLVNYKKGYDLMIPDMQKALGTLYPLVKNDLITDDNTYDIYIVIGKTNTEKATTNTKTATSSAETSTSN